MKTCVSDLVILGDVFRKITSGVLENRSLSDILISSREDIRRLCHDLFLMYGHRTTDRVLIDVFILEDSVLTGFKVDSRSLSAYVIESDSPIYLPDIREFSVDGYSLTTPANVKGLYTYFGIPIPTTYDRRLLAFMKEGYDEFDSQDRTLMRTLADHIRLAIELEGPTVARRVKDLESLKDRKSAMIVKIENLEEIAKSMGRRKASIVLKDLIESILERFEYPFIEINENELLILLKEDTDVERSLDLALRYATERVGIPLKISYTTAPISSGDLTAVSKLKGSVEKRSFSASGDVKRSDSNRWVITDEDLERFENMEKGVAIHNIERILYANKKILEMVGISREELSKYNTLSFTSPEYKEMAYRRAKLVLESGVRLPPAVEKGLNARGEPITVIVDTIPVIYKGERAVMIFVEDITEYANKEAFEGAMRSISGLLENIFDLFERPGIGFWKSLVESLRAFLQDTAFAILKVSGRSLELIEGFFGEKRVESLKVNVGEIPHLDIYLRNSKDAYFPDAKIDHGECPLGLDEFQVVSVYGYPITVEGKVEFLLIFVRPGYDSFKPWEIDIFRVIGRQLERHIRSARELEKMEKEKMDYMERAFFDPLTGARTRIFFERWLEDHRENLKDIRSTLVLIDLDCLKYINDVYGHMKGDEVLKTFSKVVMENIRGEDIFVRWGGDEFLLILPETDVELASRILERISKNLGSIDIGVKLSFSYGIAPLEDFERSFAQADEKLYHLKEKKTCGR